MDASVPPMSTAPRTTESMLGRGPRSRKRPSREELLAKPAEGARVPSSTAAGKELSFNNRNLNSGNFLAPTTTATAVAEQTSLLSRVPFVGKCLVEGTVVAFVVLILAVMACLPCRWRPAPSPDPSPDPSSDPSRGPVPGPCRDPSHNPWPYPNPSPTQRAPRRYPNRNPSAQPKKPSPRRGLTLSPATTPSTPPPSPLCPRSWPGELEQRAVFIAATMQVVALANPNPS